MKIFYSGYLLKKKRGNDSSQGALLKICFPEGIIGYADCHPWVELGDAPLNEQLSLLSKRLLTPLTERSLSFARLDGEGRSKGKSLFNDLQIPLSHRLLNDLEEQIPERCSLLKIKLGKDRVEEIKRLPGWFSQLPINTSVRLDFNNRGSQLCFRSYLDCLKSFHKKIDCIEDPFSFDPKAWESLQNEYGIPFALDHQLEKHVEAIPCGAIAVFKPAIQDCLKVVRQVRGSMLVTSYLDHPLGQMAAAYVAAIFAKKYSSRLLVCGLHSHSIYETNAYSEQLNIQEGRLLPPIGRGLGFESLLEKEKWKELL